MFFVKEVKQYYLYFPPLDVYSKWRILLCILLNDKEFCFSLIGLNSIFSTPPQSEYTSRAVSTPRVRYIRACVYFCLLSIRCFKVVQPETRFHFQSANQIVKKVKNFKISKFYKLKKKKNQNYKKKKFLKIEIFNKFKNFKNFINFL